MTMIDREREPLDEHEKRILLYLYGMFQNRTKAKIRHAWESGDYSGLGGISNSDVATLQQLRNCRGPGWLYGLKWKGL